MELIEMDNSELNDNNHHHFGCEKDELLLLPELILIFLCTYISEFRYNKFRLRPSTYSCLTRSHAEFALWNMVVSTI